jgi:hypothetical protein
MYVTTWSFLHRLEQHFVTATCQQVHYFVLCLASTPGLELQLAYYRAGATQTCLPPPLPPSALS